MSTPDPAAALLARAFDRILAWPCPTCGEAYPCPCDAQATGCGDPHLTERPAPTQKNTIKKVTGHAA